MPTKTPFAADLPAAVPMIVMSPEPRSMLTVPSATKTPSSPTATPAYPPPVPLIGDIARPAGRDRPAEVTPYESGPSPPVPVIGDGPGSPDVTVPLEPHARLSARRPRFR